MSYLKDLPNTTVLIFKGATYCGSGVVIEINACIYVLTAAHVINPCESDFKLKNYHFKTESNNKINPIAIVQGNNTINEIDLTVIESNFENSNVAVPNIRYCDEISFPGETFIFRGTPKSQSGETHSIDNCSIDTINDTEFCLRIPGDQYANSEGESGATILQGYSGSGVFFKRENSLILTGIVVSVSNDDFPGVNCISISVIKNHFINEMDLDEYHGGNEAFKVIIADIKREITTDLINDHKKNSYSTVGNLTKKMDVFLGKWDTDELDQFIEEMLFWDRIEHKKIKPNETYRSLVEESKLNLASGNHRHIVNSTSEGNARFQRIQNEFKEILKEHFKDTPLEKHVNVIAAGEIARLLANCKLKFEMQDDIK